MSDLVKRAREIAPKIDCDCESKWCNGNAAAKVINEMVDRIEQLERELAAEKAKRLKLNVNGVSVYNVRFAHNHNPTTGNQKPFIVIGPDNKVTELNLNGAAIMENTHYQSVITELAAERALADDLEKVAHGVSWDHPARAAYRKARGL